MNDKRFERQTRLVRCDIEGLAMLTELILTPDEEQELEGIKEKLIGLNVKFTPEAYNRSDKTGKITDIRIIVPHNKNIVPAAIVEFPEYSRLRFLSDLDIGETVKFDFIERIKQTDQG